MVQKVPTMIFSFGGRLEVDRSGGTGSCSYTDPQSFESSSGLRMSLMCILKCSSHEHMKSTQIHTLVIFSQVQLLRDYVGAW